MAVLEVEALVGQFPGGARPVDDVSFELAAGELFCLLGPSGCGKSTLLRLVGGYLRPQAGRVRIDQRDVTHEPPERRRAGMVFQNYALFPHLSALENVAFGLRAKGVGRAQRRAKAAEMLEWAGLTSGECERRPAHLSGGQQQRVALARALAIEPSLLMLDEPFANLDRLLRDRLRDELKQLQRRAGIATILVTHDRDEAFTLGDRIAIMHSGKLLQVGTPEGVYHHPVSALVAGFLGHRNVLCDGDAAKVGLPGAAVLLPERLQLREGGQLDATVQRVSFAGARREIAVRTRSGVTVEVHSYADVAPTVGSMVGLVIPTEAVRALPVA
jgi:ABC-type Fe3+/spermidine/putrescine transport system ATPase subunit